MVDGKILFCANRFRWHSRRSSYIWQACIVMRDVTERQEGVEASTAKLVGTKKVVILKEAFDLLDNKEAYESMAKAVNPNGDDTTSTQVLEIIKNDI